MTTTPSVEADAGSNAPPDWVLGAVWSVLYTLVGVAVWKIYLLQLKISADAFGWYAVQWVVNGLRTVVFLVFQFTPCSQLSAWLMAPGIPWVLLAGSLIAYIVFNI